MQSAFCCLKPFQSPLRQIEGYNIIFDNRSALNVFFVPAYIVFSPELHLDVGLKLVGHSIIAEDNDIVKMVAVKVRVCLVRFYLLKRHCLTIDV
jgi:hypothetical protein